MVPTGVSSRVGVDPQEEVVLVRGNFYCTVQVSVFEGAIEAQLVGGDGGVHALEGSVEEGGAVVVVILESLLTTPRATFIKLLLKIRLRGAGYATISRSSLNSSLKAYR